jgi:hypothetical protein
LLKGTCVFSMAQKAPRSPSTSTLLEKYPLPQSAKIKIAERRERLSEGFRRNQVSFTAWLGGCALTRDERVGINEARELDLKHRTEPGLIALQRQNFWKPRSNPKDPHGLETESASAADDTRRIMVARGKVAANGVAEIGHKYHVKRYGDLLVAGWIGGRNVRNTELIEAVATMAPDLPLPIKNGLDGDFRFAFEQAALVNRLRGENGAPSIPIYRGGSNALNPQAWEDEYRRALEITNGLMLVDTAHGGEMAHAPNGDFTKTVAGQIACAEHVLYVAETFGEMPVGMMMEATDSKINPVDPPMPWGVAIEIALHLNDLNNEMAGVRTQIA